MGRSKQAPDAPKEPADGETSGETAPREDVAAEPFVEPEVDQTAQVQEDLSPLEAIQRYARSAWDVQRLAYIRGIAVAAAVAGWRASRSLLPLLRELVGLPDTAVRQALASQLTPMAKSWAEDGGDAGYTDAMELLDLGLHLIGDESEEVAQAGRDAVLGMAAILVPADVPRLLAALDELACFPDEDVRQSVVIMLAGLTGLLSQRSCTEMLLPRVMRLLEDNAYLVRKESATALAEMAASVAPEACEDLCVKGIVTLSKDRVWAVRVAAAAAIPPIAAGATPESRAGILRQRLEALVADVSKWVRPVARHSLGPFLATLKSEDISEELLRHYTDTAGAKGEDAVALQVACACNLPEVTAAVGWERWEALKPALLTLASAPEAATRAALAGNLHRLAEVLPDDMAADMLLPTTESLVNDAEPSVQQALARNCADLLAALPDDSRVALFRQMSTVVAASGCAWRIRLALADQLGTIALLFDIQAVEAEVVPAAIQLCKDPVAVVRVAAADQMGQLLASSEEGARQRAEILSKSLRVLSTDPVFQFRQVYIYMCYRLIGLVEPEFFQQSFIGDLLHLEHDPVPNVRMALARMLAAADLTTLPSAVLVLQRLSQDPDMDTSQYAKAAEAVAHTPSRQLLEQAAGSHSPTRQQSIGTPRRRRSVSLNLDEAQAFRRQPGDEKSLSEVTIVPTAPETSPTLLTRSTFPDAGPAPLRRGEAARQQIAAAEAIAKHGRNSRAPSSPAPIPVSPIPASPFQSQPSGSQGSAAGGAPDEAGASSQTSSVSDQQAGPSTDNHHLTLPPLKLQESTPDSQPTSKEAASPQAIAKHASIIVVDTQQEPLKADGQDGTQGADGGEYQKGYEKGLQGIEGMQLSPDPKSALGRLHSKSA